MGDDGINDLLENAIFLFVGAFAGTLADAERTQRQRAQAVSEQLAAANTALQAQATLAEQMRASIASILDWLFILHLDCVAKRNDCTILGKRIILWLYGTPNACSVERDKPCIVRL